MATRSISTPKEPRAVQVGRRELNDDIAKVAAAIEGVRARVVGLEHYKAPIDRTTERQLEELHERLSTIVGNTRREGVQYDDDTAADTENDDADDDKPTLNEVRSILYAIEETVKLLDSSCDIDALAPMLIRECERGEAVIDALDRVAHTGGAA